MSVIDDMMTSTFGDKPMAKEVKKMDDNKGFPKYQYSEFVKNGREGQMVVRANTKEDFIKKLNEFDELMAVRHSNANETITRIPEPQPQITYPPVLRNPDMKCKICGGQAEQRSGTSRTTGKPYTGMFCTVDRDHKPSFI